MQKTINSKLRLVLFNPYQVLPLWAREDLEAMAIKGYSAFPKGEQHEGTIFKKLLSKT